MLCLVRLAGDDGAVDVCALDLPPAKPLAPQPTREHEQSHPSGKRHGEERSREVHPHEERRSHEQRENGQRRIHQAPILDNSVSDHVPIARIEHREPDKPRQREYRQQEPVRRSALVAPGDVQPDILDGDEEVGDDGRDDDEQVAVEEPAGVLLSPSRGTPSRVRTVTRSRERDARSRPRRTALGRRTPPALFIPVSPQVPSLAHSAMRMLRAYTDYMRRQLIDHISRSS